VPKSAARIRQDFIEFFRDRGHAIVPGSPVIPYDDPTLLFTNAGMNQFKDVFLGTGTRAYTRSANSQPCIRAGGKHNDLDDVGHDTYHHTFFEMLGNWSFGDYFKRDAISWAWELLTGVWGLEKRRLHATYFGGDEATGLPPDDEARDLWRSVTDIDPTHVHPGSMKDNFWEMGETGPCGPCSELHIDLTPNADGAKLVNTGDARAIEIWNLVFIQFNRGPDGRLSPLPARHVDTGMGFERVTAVLQGKKSNYDTDVFTPLFQAIRDVTGAPAYGGAMPEDSRDRGGSLDPARVMADISYRVIADHVRCLTFAINDGCLPDRDGRGYVLRRILRRGVRYGWQYLGMHEPFLHRLVPAVVDTLGDAFPQLRNKPAEIAKVLREEEASFNRTLDRGIALFNDAADFARREHHGEIRGEDAFRLHDTYGFPIDLTGVMAGEQGLRVDIGEYERLMDEARDRARGGGKAAQSGFTAMRAEIVTALGATDDTPKWETDALDATVAGIVVADEGSEPRLLGPAESIGSGAEAGVILDRTCFYAEQGGQVGDRGELGGAQLRFDVEETRRYSDTVVHFGTLVQGELKVGSKLRAHVSAKRAHTRQNHTATHVLNWALRETLGDHVQQKGSLVDAEKTRFDFSHPKALAPDEVEKIELLCRQQIEANLPVHALEADKDAALKINGLRAIFGEKYPDRVRVVSVGAPVEELLKSPEKPDWRRYSIEFCGGTHVKSTGQIEAFAITGEEAVAKGIRRVVGISGLSASLATEVGRALVREAEQIRDAGGEDRAARLAAFLESTRESSLRLVERLRIRALCDEIQQKIRASDRAAASASADVALGALDGLIASASKAGGATIVVGRMPAVGVDQLKTAADAAKQRCGSSAVFFGAELDGKALLLAAVSDDLVKMGVRAGDWVKAVAPKVDGGGGGPPTMAQAGGRNPAALDDALSAARDWIAGKLG